MNISDYDKYDYDYSMYWRARKYEDSAERLALGKLFANEKGNFFLDIGGSYGRLLEMYYEKYKHPVILDYSLKTLQKNKGFLEENYPNLSLIAANVYYMPFKEGVFDGALMVRVLHHIEKPERYFDELQRILHDSSLYIQEFANKTHLKAFLKALLKLNFSFFKHDPFQQPTQQNYEGSNGQESVFLNFHPGYVKDSLERKGFRILNTLGVSFFRIPVIKKVVPHSILILLERLSQRILSFLNITPSIVYKTRLKKESGNISTQEKIEDILACPRCKRDLLFERDLASCTGCGSKYNKKKGVWDFRVEENEA